MKPSTKFCTNDDKDLAVLQEKLTSKPIFNIDLNNVNLKFL